MHILLIPPEEFVPENAPLSGIFQYDQAKALVAMGVNVGVISVTRPIAIRPAIISLVRKLIGKKVYYKVLEEKSSLHIALLIIRQLRSIALIDFQKNEGINVLRIQCRYWNDGLPADELRYFKYCIKTASRFYLQKTGKPQLIHAHNAWLAGLSAIELSHSWNIPFGITEHSTFYARNLIPQQFYPELQICYAASAFNFVVSDSLGNLLKELKLLEDNYVYLPNMLDPLFEKTEPCTDFGNEIFTFLTIGELTKKKSQDNLILAFSRTFKGNNAVQLIIGGEGDLDKKLRHLVIEEGISSQVLLTGRLSRREVLAQMCKCDVFVLPSLFETFGVVLIEAMAMGKPVIATKSGGPESFVNDTNGILIAPANIDALSEAMKLIYKGEKIFNPSTIRSFVLQNYSSDVIASKLINVYTKVTATSNE
jgi:glycosyltransferase involved in cell wall biosynthesis